MDITSEVLKSIRDDKFKSSVKNSAGFLCLVLNNEIYSVKYLSNPIASSEQIVEGYFFFKAADYERILSKEMIFNNQNTLSDNKSKFDDACSGYFDADSKLFKK